MDRKKLLRRALGLGSILTSASILFIKKVLETREDDDSNPILNERSSSSYRVKIYPPNEDPYYLEEFFDSYDEAYDAGCEARSEWACGSEILYMSNPWENPYDENESCDFEVEEV